METYMTFFELITTILWPWSALLFLALKWLSCSARADALSNELFKLKAELSMSIQERERWKRLYENDEERLRLERLTKSQGALIKELQEKLKILEQQRATLRKNSAKSLSEIINLKPNPSKEVSS
jgi:septal ring factor EnvC (AmiA/AmiB activator)